MPAGATTDNASPLVCHRCGRRVHPGRGDHYLIRIEAVADPSGPVFTEADLARDPTAELDALLKQLETLTPQAALDQVYRRLQLVLCASCYRQWIDRPV